MDNYPDQFRRMEAKLRDAVSCASEIALSRGVSTYIRGSTSEKPIYITKGLNPRATLAQVTSVEEKLGLLLPEDYRRFVLEIADGGEIVTAKINALAPFNNKTGNVYNVVTFIPFPNPLWDEEWLDSNEATDDAWDIYSNWFNIEEPKRNSYDLAATLHCGGCDLYHHLVLSGEHRGTMWWSRHEYFAYGQLKDEAGVPLTFLTWIERMLDEFLKEKNHDNRT